MSGVLPLFLWYAKIAEHMQPRVYIETTIPSFYYEVRTEPEMVVRRNWTRTWWDDWRHAYQLVTSVAVLDALQDGTFPNQDQAVALLTAVHLVLVELMIIEIVKTYIQRMVMPRDPTGDALHLALASYHKCDFLLTWNIRNLADANKFAHIRYVNMLLGIRIYRTTYEAKSLHRDLSYQLLDG